MKYIFFILTLSSFTHIQADPLKDLTKKVESYVEGRKKANPTETANIEKFFSKLRDGVKVSSEEIQKELLETWNKVNSKTNAEWKKLEADYARSQEEKKKKVKIEVNPAVTPEVDPEAKMISDFYQKTASKGIFKVLSHDLEALQKAELTDPSSVEVERFVAKLEKKLEDVDMGMGDLSGVSGTDGETLFHLVANMAAQKERAYAKALEESQLNHTDLSVKPLQDDKAFQFDMLLLTFFVEKTNLVTARNAYGKTAVGQILAEEKKALGVLRQIVDHDKSGAVAAEVTESLKTAAPQ